MIFGMQAIRMLRACARVPWFGALALESRATATRRPTALAEHAAWLASNVLAACGYWVRRDGELAELVGRTRAVCVNGGELRALLATLAAIPALPVGPSLPQATRAMLRVLGIPMVDAIELAGEARAMVGDAAFARRPLVVDVQPDATGYMVGVAAVAPALDTGTRSCFDGGR
jgi:hypothetical protein